MAPIRKQRSGVPKTPSEIIDRYAIDRHPQFPSFTISDVVRYTNSRIDFDSSGGWMAKSFDRFRVTFSFDTKRFTVCDETAINQTKRRLFIDDPSIRALEPARKAQFIAAVLEEAKKRPEVAAVVAKYPDIFRTA